MRREMAMRFGHVRQIGPDGLSRRIIAARRSVEAKADHRIFMVLVGQFSSILPVRPREPSSGWRWFPSRADSAAARPMQKSSAAIYRE